jgi:hypothetical protein
MDQQRNLIVMADIRRASQFYLLCGWHTLSDVPLTGVPTSEHLGERIDIHIQLASGGCPIAKNAGQVVFDHSAERSHIGIQGIAHFEISNGRQIRIWPTVGALQRDIEIVLFGPAWATLCHQRGLLPLHASAIATAGGITAFAGRSGAGKSTIAALLASLDYELIADDILPVSFDDNSVPGAWPYLRGLKLRSDSISQLGFMPTEQVSETLDSEKYFVYSKCAPANRWTKLERLYLLETNPTNSRISIDRLTGAEAVHALVDHTYHFQFIPNSGRLREHLAFCTQLASKIAVYRLHRAPSFDTRRELGSVISTHLELAPK